MKEYIQVKAEAEWALNNGKYKCCIEIIKPLLNSFSVSSKEGINLRMLLITAYSGINEKEEALKICKKLSKSRSSQVRENAKSLIQILNAPDLNTPDNWNIKFENNINDRNESNQNKKISKEIDRKEKFINILNKPTGETKPFQKGFVFITFILLISLMLLLSGCVKIENNLDLRNINSINMNLGIESKYIAKMPWQINFENKISENFINSIIKKDQNQFLVSEKRLSLNETKNKLNKIIRIASETASINFEDIKIDHYEKDYFFIKKHFFNIIFNLVNLDNIDELDLSINIKNPAKPVIQNQTKNIKILQKNIHWQLIPGEINNIKYSYWKWNNLFISFSISITLVLIAFIVKVNRYEMGSDLPKLPN